MKRPNQIKDTVDVPPTKRLGIGDFWGTNSLTTLRCSTDLDKMYERQSFSSYKILQRIIYLIASLLKLDIYVTDSTLKDSAILT